MSLGDEALHLLRANRRWGYSSRHGLPYAYTCPSPRSYPYQWLWDSCFHAIVLADLDPDWAREELRSLVSVQRPDGFLPHVIFWRSDGPSHYWKYLQDGRTLRPRTTAYIQPPVLAFAAARVFHASGDQEFGLSMLRAIRRFHAWLRRDRDPDGDGLISIVSPFESGMDWSPQFDPLFKPVAGSRLAGWLAPRFLDLRHWLGGHKPAQMLRRFDVEEVAPNSIWYEAQTSLAELGRELGDRQIEQEERSGAGRTREGILGRCWDPVEGAFFSLSGHNERKLRVRTVASLLPLLVDGLDRDRVSAIVKEIQDPARFGTPFPLPSVAVRERSFQRNPGTLLWRGPTWLNMNWFVVRGLLKHGEVVEAQRLARAGVAMVERSGFRECYEPYDGRGMGALDFGWSALAADLVVLAAT